MDHKHNRFGIWADPRYVTQVKDNAKVYRKIRDMRRYYRKHNITKSLLKIIEDLKDPEKHPLWSARMRMRSAESWRKHFYDR